MSYTTLRNKQAPVQLLQDPNGCQCCQRNSAFPAHNSYIQTHTKHTDPTQLLLRRPNSITYLLLLLLLLIQLILLILLLPLHYYNDDGTHTKTTTTTLLLFLLVLVLVQYQYQSSISTSTSTSLVLVLVQLTTTTSTRNNECVYVGRQVSMYLGVSSGILKIGSKLPTRFQLQLRVCRGACLTATMRPSRVAIAATAPGARCQGLYNERQYCCARTIKPYKIVGPIKASQYVSNICRRVLCVCVCYVCCVCCVRCVWCVLRVLCVVRGVC